MTLPRAIPLLVLAAALTGCENFVVKSTGDRRPGGGPDVLTRLEAGTDPGLPEIVPLPAPAPPPALEPAPAPATAFAASRPEATATRPPAPLDPEIAVPRRPRARAAAPKAAAGPHARTYVVRKGDTLQKISMKFYGTTRNWEKIFEANRGKLKKPDLIVVGTVLKIP